MITAARFDEIARLVSNCRAADSAEEDALCDLFDELSRLRQLLAPGAPAAVPPMIYAKVPAPFSDSIAVQLPISESAWQLLGELQATGLYGKTEVDVAGELLRLALRAEHKLRKTPAEVKALDALHLWLHDSAGDMNLIEDTQDYHDQCEARAQCEHAEAAAQARLVTTPEVIELATAMRRRFMPISTDPGEAPPVRALALRFSIEPPLLDRFLAVAQSDRFTGTHADVAKQLLALGVGEVEGLAPEPAVEPEPRLLYYAVPEDWQPKAHHRLICEQRSLDLDEQVAQFRCFEFATPVVSVDVRFVRWLHHAVAMREAKAQQTPPSHEPS